MKRLTTIIATLIITLSGFAQAPEKMSYQAVIRDASDMLVTYSNIGMQMSILQGSSTGIAVYVERHFPTTDANGLVSLEIGTGTIISGDLANIDWENGPYFIKTETDLNGGSNYTISGTSQLLSIPYALHAKTAASAEIADDAITSEKIKNGEVKSVDIASDAVGTSEIENSSIINEDISLIADIAASKILGDAGIEYTLPDDIFTWADGEYSATTLASITMDIPQSGYVILIHTGYVGFFGQNRTMHAGIGTNPTTVLNYVRIGYLDGSGTERYKLPYSIISVVEVTEGTLDFYAIGEGESSFSTGVVNMVPTSFIGIFIPKRY